MGDKIGDYIHLSYNNYLKYGLNKSGGSANPPAPYVVFSDLRKRILSEARAQKNKYPENVRTGLEKQLNYFYAVKSGQPTNFKIEGGLTKEQLNEITKMITQKLESYKPQIGELNLETGAYNLSANLSEKEREVIKKVSASIGGDKRINRQRLEQRINTLLLARDIIVSDGIKGDTATNLLSRMEQLFKDFEAFEKDISTSKTGKSFYYKTSEKGKNFVKDLNNLTKEVGKLTHAAAYQGKYEELFVIAMNKVAEKGFEKGMKEIAKMFSAMSQGEKMPGDVGSHHALNITSNLEATVAKAFKDTAKSSGLKSTKITEDILYSTIETPDKIDAILTFEDNDSIPVSIKNYDLSNDKGDVHLLKGSSVLKLLQEYGVFINHYLNINSTPTSKDTVKRRGSAGLRREARATMQALILYKALAGGVTSYDSSTNSTFTTQKADFFIINDNSGKYGNIRVLFIHDILQYALENIQKGVIATGDFDKDTEIVNKFVLAAGEGGNEAAASKRIANMLMDLHRMKLNVTIKKGAIKKI